MKQTAFLNRLEELYAKNLEISRKKNADYANEGDALQNFRLIETLTSKRIPAGDAILVRITDKIQRIANLMEPGRKAQVIDESLLDALSDCANYLMILRIYLEENAD